MMVQNRNLLKSRLEKRLEFSLFEGPRLSASFLAVVLQICNPFSKKLAKERVTKALNESKAVR